MNTHRTFGFVAAVLVMVGQIAVFAVDTAAVAENTVARAGYENSLDSKAALLARVANSESAGSAIV